MNRSGQCLCGAVRLDARLTGDGIHMCHCRQCQRWTGGGPFTVVAVSELAMTGQDSIGTYHASDWGERGFCKQCGSTLYWTMQGRDVQGVPVGLLDDQTGLKVTEEIFVDHRPDWLAPYVGASQSTEAQEVAKLDAYLAERGQ